VAVEEAEEEEDDDALAEDEALAEEDEALTEADEEALEESDEEEDALAEDETDALDEACEDDATFDEEEEASCPPTPWLLAELDPAPPLPPGSKKSEPAAHPGSDGAPRAIRSEATPSVILNRNVIQSSTARSIPRAASAGGMRGWPCRMSGSATEELSPEVVAFFGKV
jgi:hypothetical protein